MRFAIGEIGETDPGLCVGTRRHTRSAYGLYRSAALVASTAFAGRWSSFSSSAAPFAQELLVYDREGNELHRASCRRAVLPRGHHGESGAGISPSQMLVVAVGSPPAPV
jgi:hypothetical protein